MRFMGYEELEGRPNVIVDGYGADGTVLVLSHWPGSGTPEVLKDDLSTMIAFRYLDHPELTVEAEAVSNNHFDEDGLCGIFAVLHPEEALARRERIIDVASAGDFGVFRSRDAFRVSTALMAYEDRDRSPLAIFDLPYPKQSAALYEELLERLPHMIDSPETYRELWGEQDAALEATLGAIASGTIRIEERPDLDLAVVTVADSFAGEVVDAGLYSSTLMTRVLVQHGHRYDLRYRYESWVDYRSRPVPARIDLTPLAKLLSEDEPAGRWRFDGVDHITPRLRLSGAEASAIPPERFRSSVESFLAA